jgi:hypothetical protein
MEDFYRRYFMSPAIRTRRSEPWGSGFADGGGYILTVRPFSEWPGGAQGVRCGLQSIARDTRVLMPTK